MAFMQYWLINWNNPCPAGWSNYSTDCYTNSNGVTVPQEVITELKKLKLSGSANGNCKKAGIDTLVLTAGTNAYSTTGADTSSILRPPGRSRSSILSATATVRRPLSTRARP